MDGTPSGLDPIKDFSGILTPLVLAVFGFWFQGYFRKRDKANRAEEQYLAQYSQTWNTQLPEMYKLAFKHYLPLGAAAAGVIGKVADYKKLKAASASAESCDEAAKKGFYYFALLARRMRAFQDKLNGFYFKNRIGEEFASECMRKYLDRSLMRDSGATDIFGALLDHVDVNEREASFRAKLKNSDGKQFSDGWTAFRTQLEFGELDEALPYLNAFTAVLLYEVNRPWEYWYGRKETLDLDPEGEKALEALAKNISSRPGRQSFLAEAREYLGHKPGMNGCAICANLNNVDALNVP